MRRCFAVGALLLFLGAASYAQKTVKKEAGSEPPPILLPSEELVNAYMHRMFGFDPNISWKIVSITESKVPGMALVVLRLGEGEGRTAQLFVSTDGKHAIDGKLVPFGRDPFKEDREILARRAKGPFEGDAKAPVTIVEFSDLECPHCKAAQPRLDRLIAEEPRARLVFQEFPLESLHPWAFTAATFAECIAQQKPKVFWTFIRSVYDNQLEITPQGANDKLKDLVGTAGANGAEIATCAGSEGTKAAVRASMQLGLEVGVEGTPTVFINGRKIQNLSQLPFETLKRLVEFEASETQKAAPPHPSSTPK